MAQERVLDKVQRLLDLANDSGATEEERDLALTRANEMMVKHAIAQSVLDAHCTARGEKMSRDPETVVVPFIPVGQEFDLILYDCVAYLGLLARVIPVRLLSHDDQSSLSLSGFPDDIEYFQMLWLSTYLQFSNKLFPKWDTEKSLDENVKFLKDAGFKWKEIWFISNNTLHPNGAQLLSPKGKPIGCPPNDNHELIKAYRRQCELEGVQPENHTQRHGAYRESYALGFKVRLSQRIAEMRYAASQEAGKTTGAEVALVDSSRRVVDLVASLYPNMKHAKDYKPRYGTEEKGSRAGHAAANETDLSGGRNRLGSNKTAIGG